MWDTALFSAMETQSAIIGLPKGLSTREQFLMHELIIVNARLKEPLEIEPSHKASEDFDLMDVLRIIDLALRRIINMAKELSAFKELMQADQIALLKGSSIELLILRGVMVYDPLRDVWNPRSIHGEKEMEIRLNVLKMSQRREHYEEHKKFLNTFDEKWRRNENVMLILSALTLFDADRPNVTHITKVRTFYAQYQDLLRRYLQLTCSPDESQRAMKLLLDKLVDVRHLNHGLLEVLYGLNLNEVDPLLLELFDLGKAPRLSADV
ncbi:hypothetical protein AB6A40_008957 [Gnathostoma spinigerum]|uniref:NR LBD domain-containing protein n=1 Tax=Gnathostoma spinigerum TaxID=75299 RepID=A0ABD6EQX8_9BILA